MLFSLNQIQAFCLKYLCIFLIRCKRNLFFSSSGKSPSASSQSCGTVCLLTQRNPIASTLCHSCSDLFCIYTWTTMALPLKSTKAHSPKTIYQFCLVFPCPWWLSLRKNQSSCLVTGTFQKRKALPKAQEAYIMELLSILSRISTILGSPSSSRNADPKSIIL